ncbi:MAG: MmcQ/YjbR family DNA-binding protein [Acidobacteria bacterium]|nr:MmcQ/YjbR family DNA-binding protein [Acidobacteriota bacterium]
MDIAAFRAAALSLPEVEEKPHWERTSFRIRNKIIATLDESKRLAVIKLDESDAEALARALPEAVKKRYWGVQVWTEINLDLVELALVETLLRETWAKLAPKRLARR